jgi:drug/metabolite transporter (DMT)-like permease
MNSSIVAAILAVIGYSLLNVGQASQKIGLSIRQIHHVRGSLIWTIATIGTLFSFPLVFVAISIGSLAVVGAMAGTGLISLTIFSGFVLKEHIRPITVTAILAVACAAAVIAVFEDEQASSVRLMWLYVLLVGGVGGYSIGILTVSSARGVLIGGLSGFLGAYSQIFQRLGTTDISLASGVSAFLLHVVSNPVTLIWVGLSLVSMVTIQFAYRHAAAIRIVPVFTANFILVPVIGAVVVFGEQLHNAQWIAVVIMVGGSVVLSRPAATHSHERQTRSLH